MRFNDLLQTVLANMGDGSVATVTRWRQCIDLLAQYDVSGAEAANALSDADRQAVLDLIADMRIQISVEQRVTSVTDLGSRLRSPGLVRLLSQDHPSLVAAMMSHVRLTDEDWAAIIPDLGPFARSILRRRQDLGMQALAALQRFGSVDLTLTSLVPSIDVASELRTADVIPMPVANEPAGEEEPSQIGRIVAQIERFQDERQHRHEDDPQLFTGQAAAEAILPAIDAVIEAPAPPPINEFTFETDGAGLFRAIAGAPRSAAAGLTIGAPALDSRQGADGTALGAFRRRAAFANARFAIGEGVLKGEWRISADPRFDRASGRFLNYAGTARRERPHEGLVKATSDIGGWAGLSAGSTRQLIHELRTPLNAIHGYAEMIDAELAGPVSDDYRGMARQILADARSLIATFDDLDLASRIERGDDRAVLERIDPEQIVRAVVASFDQDGGAPVDLTVQDMLPMIGGDRAQTERMLRHLFRAGCLALGEGERLFVMLAPNASIDSVHITMHRPVALRHVSDDALLDHGYLVDQKLRDAPPLGIAFTFKLVRGIAMHLGGRFEITPDSFTVILPSEATAGSEQERLR